MTTTTAMQFITEIRLNDGRTDRTESHCPPPPATGEGWHPMKYALQDVEAMAAYLLSNEGVDPLGKSISAITDFVPGDKWTCTFSGTVQQHGEPIGTFTASIHSPHD